LGKHAKYGALVACLLAAGQAAAEGCRLALALGLDVSRSVSRKDYAIQAEGLIAALRAPEVRAAMFAEGGWVALAVYEWSGRQHQERVAGWVEVQTQADLDALVGVLRAHERNNVHLPTGLGEALSYGRRLLAAAPDCGGRTLDISGDGQNNDGRAPAAVYAAEDFGAIIVNGLPIGGHEADIADYYGREVIRGPGAFVEPAARHEDYPAAIRRKLLKELTVRLMGQAAADGGAG
jgi:hypothetical protein